MHLCLINRLIEAKAIGDLLIRRIAKYRLSSTNHDRNVCDADVKTIEQMLNIGVAVKIDICVRITVAGQEFFNAQCSGGMPRADEHGVSNFMCDQLHSSEDERAHQSVAQLAVRLHQRQQLFARDINHFAIITRADAGESAPAGEHVRFARELTRLESDDGRLGRA